MSVFPSLWEGTPITVVRSARDREAIVASDADGLLDILTDRHDAMIVPKRNAEALAGRIVELIDAPDRRASWRSSARETARHYDIDAFVRKMERLYGILHRHSRATRRDIARAADLSFLTEKAAT